VIVKAASALGPKPNSSSSGVQLIPPKIIRKPATMLNEFILIDFIILDFNIKN
jgi:hypothetical protein